MQQSKFIRKENDLAEYEIEERLKALEGITYKEWYSIKLVIDNRFSEIKNENTLSVDENVLKELNAIF